MAAAEARRKQEAEAQRKKLEEKNRQEAETLKKRLEEKKMAEKLAESKKEAEVRGKLLFFYFYLINYLFICFVVWAWITFIVSILYSLQSKKRLEAAHSKPIAK